MDGGFERRGGLRRSRWVLTARIAGSALAVGTVHTVTPVVDPRSNAVERKAPAADYRRHLQLPAKGGDVSSQSGELVVGSALEM